MTNQTHPDNAGAQGSKEQALSLIRGWRWFAHVPATAQEWLAQRARLQTVARDKMIYLAGEPFTHVYAVMSGALRIYTTTKKGDEITLEEVVKGGWFPHMLPAQQPVYLGNCVCIADAMVAAFPQTMMAEFARQWPGYYQGLYEEFVLRAVATIGRIELLSVHTLNVRLAVYLLRMARLRGHAEPGGTMWVPGSYSQAEVGARVGAARQQVNGLLKKWQATGLIEMHKDGIRILKMPQLIAEAEQSGFEVSAYLAGWHGGWQGAAE